MKTSTYKLIRNTENSATDVKYTKRGDKKLIKIICGSILSSNSISLDPTTHPIVYSQLLNYTKNIAEYITIDHSNISLIQSDISMYPHVKSIVRLYIPFPEKRRTELRKYFIKQLQKHKQQDFSNISIQNTETIVKRVEITKVNRGDFQETLSISYILEISNPLDQYPEYETIDEYTSKHNATLKMNERNDNTYHENGNVKILLDDTTDVTNIIKEIAEKQDVIKKEHRSKVIRHAHLKWDSTEENRVSYTAELGFLET